MTSSNGNIFSVTGLLGGEFNGHGEFPAQRPATRSFDVFFDMRLNKRLSKQSWGWWFETPSCSLWRHCNVKVVSLTLGQSFCCLKTGLWRFPLIRVCSWRIGTAFVSFVEYPNYFVLVSSQFLFILVHSWTYSWYIIYSQHIGVHSCAIRVYSCLSVLPLYWFVRIRVNVYHVRGAFSLSLSMNIWHTS